ncbi:MAG: prolipoprotein diacylglyceryl transferase family protein [Proteocatella sp.]
MLPVINFKLGNIVFNADTYPIFIFISMAAGFVMSLIQLKKIGLSLKIIVFIYVSICTSFLAGARFFNFMLRWDDYKRAGISLFTLKFSYFSLYGGIMLSVLVLWLILDRFKINKLLFFDKLTIPFLTSLIIMKIGCFLNGCCYGKHTISFFSVPLPVREAEKLASSRLINFLFNTADIRVYPTQLMEAFSSAVIILMLVIYRKKLFEGASFFCAAILLSMARLLILNYRSTSYSEFVLNLAYPLFYTGIIASGVWFFVIHRKNNFKKREAEA